jgi:hypothetical protein
MHNLVGGPTYRSTRAIEDLTPVVLADMFCPKRNEGEYIRTSSSRDDIHSLYSGDALVCRVITSSSLGAGITL